MGVVYRTALGGLRGGGVLGAEFLRQAFWLGGRWLEGFFFWVVFWFALQVQTEVAMMLPHELIHQLAMAGDEELLGAFAGLDRTSTEHMQHVTELMGPVIPLALWGDSTPFSWDKKQSCEMLAVSLPGLPEDSPWKAVRVPIIAIPHDQVVVGKTLDDILLCFSKSMQASMAGTFPLQRLDGKDFCQGDSWRRKRAGKTLKAKACLCEIKGDWKHQKEPGFFFFLGGGPFFGVSGPLLCGFDWVGLATAFSWKSRGQRGGRV